jgi:hypothetical protein
MTFLIKKLKEKMRMTTEIQMAKDGEFLREYGKQYFVVASEALSIGRVKWNMVPIGKAGQGDITFYLTTEQMLSLCSDILSGKFHSKIKEDSGSAYPTAYAYMTGEDGCLHLAIGGGKSGCRIQMRNMKATPKALSYIMGVSLDAMVTMARKYMLCAGMVPVVPGSYYDSVIKAFEEGRGERSKYRKPAASELGDVVNTNNIVEDNETADCADAQSQESKPVEKPEADTKTDTIACNYAIRVNGKKTTKRGFFAFDGVDESGNAVTLLFRKAEAENISWFKKFEDAAAVGETTITLSGEKRDNCVLYVGPAKK